LVSEASNRRFRSEVEYSEEPGHSIISNTFGRRSGDYLPVATTRPKTILGDTAVAVHPEDERYQKYIGKTALVPIAGEKSDYCG
jgi:valyl-tRNA synthetase